MKKLIVLILLIIAGSGFIAYKMYEGDQSFGETVQSISDDISGKIDDIKEHAESEKERLEQSSVAKSVKANNALTDKLKETKSVIDEKTE